MTHNTQGGIARREKALEILNKNIGAEVLGTFGETDTQWIIDAMIEFSESPPLPASPEGTWETEFEKLYAKKNYYNLVSFVQSIFQPIQQENEFKRNMIADLDSMNERLKQENERLKEELEDSITFSKKAIEIATDEMAKLKSQLAEAREALTNTEKTITLLWQTYPKQMERFRKALEEISEKKQKASSALK